jgi:hypothetical protein
MYPTITYSWADGAYLSVSAGDPPTPALLDLIRQYGPPARVTVETAPDVVTTLCPES